MKVVSVDPSGAQSSSSLVGGVMFRPGVGSELFSGVSLYLYAL